VEMSIIGKNAKSLDFQGFYRISEQHADLRRYEKD